MKFRFIQRLTRINQLVFPFMVLFTFVVLGLETYSYIGFIGKFILIDSRFFFNLSIFSAIFLIISGKKSYLSDLTFRLNSLVLIAGSVTYLFLQFLEAQNFHNYVFSRYHIQPNNMLYIVILSLILAIISKLRLPKKFLNVSPYLSIIMVVTLVIFLNGMVETANAALYSDIYIISHINKSYDYKMTERWGVYYQYIKFVKDNTPENSIILIPPKELPWLSTGNEGLDRYFLYPRRLINGNLDEVSNTSNYDYAMLVWGEWNGAPKEKYGWPKASILAEKVIFFDPITSATKSVDGGYNLGGDSKYGEWGLIKIKK